MSILNVKEDREFVLHVAKCTGYTEDLLLESAMIDVNTQNILGYIKNSFIRNNKKAFDFHINKLRKQLHARHYLNSIKNML